ncbi:DNA-directed RNA polymerase III subunit 1-like [Salvia hispanica]|uniref:DNA-directed RNA polymerase III subunit 1-like n=1 Tax=Salvia hispanica TaxID=49212 RepID=UPI00200977C0|nr:DNA-directed RNA polymerase III subunit 1-like [Salvia hispanica]
MSEVQVWRGIYYNDLRKPEANGLLDPHMKCSIVLLEENERRDFLKKMRGPKLEHLKKIEILETIVKRCNSLGGTRRSVVCSRCGYINGMVKKKQMTIIHDRARVADSADCSLEECRLALSHTKANMTLPLNLDPKRVYELLTNMRDEDCELLYLNDRPENLMFTSILVPPTSIRPSVFVDGGTQRNETDITERLKSIIKANASLRSEMAETDSQSRCMV